MFKAIFQTVISRLAISFLLLLVVYFSALFYGSVGRGIISLFMLNISLMVIINGFMGGGALVYMVANFNVKKLLIAAYLWASVFSVIGMYVLYLLDFIPEQLFYYFLPALYMQSIITVNQNILTGLKKIQLANYVWLIQAFLLLIMLLAGYYFFHYKEISYYGICFCTSSFLAALYSFFSVYNNISQQPDLDKKDKPYKKMLTYGSQTQISNLIQLLNYRMGFYILEKIEGIPHEQKLSYIGILSIGMQMAESLWIISRSAATVQYAEISYAENKTLKLDITYKTIRVSFFITFLLLIPLLLIPDFFYAHLLGKDFNGLQKIILFLSPGILLYTIAVGISHYFSGTGIFIYNLITTLIAFVVTLAGGLFFIPDYFHYGAAAVCSVSYTVMAIGLLFIFYTKHPLQLRELIIRKNDVQIFIKKFEKYKRAT